jgi:hypothetical protein
VAGEMIPEHANVVKIARQSVEEVKSATPDALVTARSVAHIADSTFSFSKLDCIFYNTINTENGSLNSFAPPKPGPRRNFRHANKSDEGK